MIIQLLVSPIFLILDGLVSLIPDMPKGSGLGEAFKLLIANPLSIFPLDMFIFMIGSVSFWIMCQFLWSLVEWVYKKLPGIN